MHQQGIFYGQKKRPGKIPAVRQNDALGYGRGPVYSGTLGTQKFWFIS